MKVIVTDIPLGLCACGCGQRTNVYARSDPSRGHRRGEPARFVRGHGMRYWSQTNQGAYDVEDRGHESHCWVWRGKLNPDGYAGAMVDRRSVRVHRHYYIERFGDPGDGVHLDHLCRVRACVNPEHLEPVTTAENTRRGLSTKLTRSDVWTILDSPHVPGVALARRFAVSQATICDIRKGRKWADVGAEHRAQEVRAA